MARIISLREDLASFLNNDLYESKNIWRGKVSHYRHQTRQTYYFYSTHMQKFSLPHKLLFKNEARSTRRKIIRAIFKA